MQYPWRNKGSFSTSRISQSQYIQMPETEVDKSEKANYFAFKDKLTVSQGGQHKLQGGEHDEFPQLMV